MAMPPVDVPVAEPEVPPAGVPASDEASAGKSELDLKAERDRATGDAAASVPATPDTAAPGSAVDVEAALREALERAERKKALGNAAVQAKDYNEAVRLYGEAITEANGQALAVYFQNRAIAQAALGNWHAVIADAGEALVRPGGMTKKACFQKARAELRLELLAEAEKTLAVAEAGGLRADVERLLRDDGCALPRKDKAAVGSRSAQVPPSVTTAATASSAAAASTPAAATVGTAAGAEDAAGLAKQAGTAKYKAGAYKEALAEYKRALVLLPSGDDRRGALLGNVAAAHLMLKQAAECCTVCEEALALDPSNVKVRARLSAAHSAQGDFDAARAALAAGGEAAVASDAALSNAAKQVEEWQKQLSLADTALSSGEPAKALSKYAELETKALFAYPGLALKMGRCYLELKNFPRVLNTTQQVLRANPRNSDALVLRAEALYRNNTAGVEEQKWVEPLEQGQKLLKEALSFDPDHRAAQALRKRLRLLCSKHGELKEEFTNRNFEKAQEVLDQMIEESSDNVIMLAGLYCHRATIGVRLKDWRAVLKDVGQATYRCHDLVQPYLLRAQALQNLDRHEDAVKELEGLFSWHRDQAVYDKLQEAKFLVKKKKRTNYYELLQVPSVASQLEIKKAYKERASEWHPDKKAHLDEAARKNAEEMFKRVGEAYEVLTDAEKKELYDKGYDLEGIGEQIELKKRRTEHHGHHMHRGHG